MDFKNQNNESTQTITLEKVIQTQDAQKEVEHVHTLPEINLFSSDSLTKKVEIEESSPKAEKSDDKLEKLKKQILENQREKEEKEKEEAQHTHEDVETEQTDAVEESVESLYNTSLMIEPSADEVSIEEIESTNKSNQKGYKFRFRLLTGVFCCLMAILVGWIIGNSIELASTSSNIATESATSQEYNVNIAQYLSKIEKLNDATDDVPPQPGEGSLLPIEEVITITPQPLDDPTEYEQESNWFDSICNWLRHLFGG